MDNPEVPPSPETTRPVASPKLSLQPLYTVLILIFGMLLGAGGLFAYQEYMTAPPVTSFDECINAKGSITQESYPATCITRDKKRFVQPINDEVTPPNSPVSTYVSQQAHVTLTLPKAMYVTDTIVDVDGWQRGSIIISTHPGGSEEVSNLTIVYGIPTIDGKGGACIGKEGESLWQKKSILESTVNVCETATGLHAGYPKHPTEKIEYAFYIGGKELTAEEVTLYKQILYDGLAFTPTSTFPIMNFSCPKTAWVDCMPGPDMVEKIECTSEYLTWARESCPGFEGAAL